MNIVELAKLRKLFGGGGSGGSGGGGSGGSGGGIVMGTITLAREYSGLQENNGNLDDVNCIYVEHGKGDDVNGLMWMIENEPTFESKYSHIGRIVTPQGGMYLVGNGTDNNLVTLKVSTTPNGFQHTFTYSPKNYVCLNGRTLMVTSGPIPRGATLRWVVW